MSHYYNKTNRNTIFGISATGISVVLTAIIMPMIVVRFGSDNWARYSFFLLYVGVLTFIESSLQLYVSQKTAAAYSTTSDYIWKKDRRIILILITTLIIASIILSINLTYKITQDDTLNYMIGFAIINVFPRAISSAVKGSMQGLKSQVRYYGITTLLNLSRPFYLLIVLLLLNPKIISLVIAYVIYSYVEMMVYIFIDRSYGQKEIKLIVNKVDDSKLLFSLLTANILSVIASNLDKILIFTTVSLAQASFYTFAATLAGLLFIFVNVAIASFGPKFKELFLNNNKEIIKQNLYTISFINNLLVMFGAVVFCIIGHDLLQPIAFKMDVDSVINTFTYLGLASIFSSNLWIPGVIATSANLASFNVKTNLIFIGVYLISFYGVNSNIDQFIFAKSMLVAAFATTIMGLLYFSRNVFKLNLIHYIFKTIMLPAIIVCIISLPLWWINNSYGVFLINLIYILTLIILFASLWYLSGKNLKLFFNALINK